MTARTVSDRVLKSCAALAERDDTALATALLARQRVHAGRTREELGRWARLAVDAGRDAASRDGTRESGTDPDEQARQAGLTVRHAHDGLRSGWVVVAEYTERSREVRVHQDALQLAEWLVDRLGWRAWYPTGALRRAAVAHELGHRRLHGPAARELRTALGLVTLRIGRHRRYGHVSGAPELFAHGYAERTCALGRSPLLLTQALALAAGVDTGKDGS